MVKKITYSRRQPDKRRLSFDFDQVRENDDGRKRTKTAHESDEVQFVTPASKTRAKKPLVSKKSAFGGPVSIPDDADLEPSPRSGNRLSVFDKVLSNGRHQPEKTDENSLQSNKQQFSEMMKIGQRSREHNDQKSKRYLPTPPAEVQRKGHDEVQEDEGFVRLNGYVDKDGLNTPETSPTPSTRTFQLFGQARKNAPREPYQPRAYKALLTPAPREKIGGSLLSRESRETQLWSTNQVSSPFLQLPQNVRDIIYRYTLGGKTVNINYETYRITFDPTRPQVAKKVMPVFKYNCTVIDGKMNPFQAAAKPYIKIRKSFTLLNSVCRQLYVETATLPYKLNMMCFASHNIMVNFVLMEKRLSREQLDALTQLLLRNELPGPNLLACLRNLEKVYLVSDQSGKSSGWYHVEREEGKEPNLVQAPKGRA